MKDTEKTQLSSPIDSLHHTIKAFFADDDDVEVSEIDRSTCTVTLTVSNLDKFGALSRIVRTEQHLGNMYLFINIVYKEADYRHYYDADDLETALTGNPHFKQMFVQYDPLTGKEYHYCIFRNEVIQYFDDLLNDPYGTKSTLMQDMAQDIFKYNDVFYCTDTGRYDE